MTRPLVPSILGLMLLAGGCENAPQQEVPTADVSPGTSPSEPFIAPGVREIHGIMQAKLVHSHALLDSIAMEDMARVEQHAAALTELSRESDWQVHTTMAYGVFSDQFRQASTELAAHARAGSMPAVTEDYSRLIGACMACHDYLRREGLIKDLPGVVSDARGSGELPLLARYSYPGAFD